MGINRVEQLHLFTFSTFNLVNLFKDSLANLLLSEHDLVDAFKYFLQMFLNSLRLLRVAKNFD